MAEYRSRNAKPKFRPVVGIFVALMVIACPTAVLVGAFIAFEIGTRS